MTAWCCWHFEATCASGTGLAIPAASVSGSPPRTRRLGCPQAVGGMKLRGARRELCAGGRGRLCEKRRFLLPPVPSAWLGAIPASLAPEMFRGAPTPPWLQPKTRALISPVCWPGDAPGLHQSWPGQSHQPHQSWSQSTHSQNGMRRCQLCSGVFPREYVPGAGPGASACTGASLTGEAGAPLPWRVKPGLCLLGRVWAERWAGGDQCRQRGRRWSKSPAASDRKSWVLPLFFFFPFFLI